MAGCTSSTGQILPLTVVNGAKASITSGSVLCTRRPVSRPWVVEVEVAVLNQQRQLERRALGQPELALALVADDPQPGQPGVHVELGDAHDVVVVPEQRRALVHRVMEDGVLARREQVLRPAVKGSRGEAAVQVHDGVTGERGRLLVGRAAAQSRHGTAPARRRRRAPRGRSSRRPAAGRRARCATRPSPAARARPRSSDPARFRRSPRSVTRADRDETGANRRACAPSAGRSCSRRDQAPRHREGVDERRPTGRSTPGSPG